MKNRFPSLALSLSMALALGALATPSARAQGFALEGAIIDSRNGNSLGVVTERGDLNTLFRAQKAMTFGILRSAGISLEQLSPEVRARIERFATTNVEAFRAFSQGLDLKDQGKYAEAREFFKRASQLDPGFALASEQQQSMPDVNLGGNLQMRAVMVAAAGAAVDRGKASYVVDVARATAALQAGQTVVTVPAAVDQTQPGANGYTSNPAGSGTQFVANQVVGLAYGYTGASGVPVNVTASNEWRADQVRIGSGVLELAGSATSGFLAQRLSATSTGTGSLALPDGTLAYWGSWASAPGASAAVVVSGTPITAPTLGRVDYVLGEAPRAMPSTGNVNFVPGGGPLGTVTGSIGVNFISQSVVLQNLGFQIGGQSFSGLNGSAQYDPRIASGAFSGNYSSGACAGCVAFNPQSSLYTGNFIGRDAHGLVFSTILLTGNGGTASGVHLFTRP